MGDIVAFGEKLKMIQYWDKKYNCSVIELKGDPMYLNQKVLAKVEGIVKELTVIKLFDLDLHYLKQSGDEVLCLDETTAKEYLFKVWEIKPCQIKSIKVLNPDEIKSTELPLEKIEKESEEQ